MPNNANILYLLQLLKEDSDESHILTMPRIITGIKALGASPSIDRRTVYSLINSLIEMGYDISTYAENKKGYFLRTRDLEESEIILLVDSVATSKSIPYHQRKELIKKLAGLGGKRLKPLFNNNIFFLSENFIQNSEIFLNIELILEAILAKRQVILSSCNYGADKVLHPLYDGRRFIVNPYQMVVQNQKHYLICNYENNDDLTHIRLDRMTNVEIIKDSKAKPHRFDLNVYMTYMTEHPYMYSGESVSATMRISKNIIGDVLDTFGKEVRLFDNRDGTMNAIIKANRKALSYWSVQYGTECEVLEPQVLRDDIIKMIKSIAGKYLKG